VGCSLRKPAISLKRCKIGPRLLLMANRKLHTRSRWVPKSTILKGHYALYFKTRASFGAHRENLNEDRLYCQRRRYSAMTLDSGSIRFMQIFEVVLKICVNFQFYACACILRIHVPHAFFVIKFSCYCLLQLYTSGCSGEL